MIEELKNIPSKVNLALFDVGVFSKDKIREMFRGGKLPTADAMVEEVILRAVKEGATDIHIEPKENELRIRLGSEGILEQLVALPKEISENISNIVKTKANLNQFEKKKPQEGRYVVTIANFQFEIRVSTLPTISGERVALRIFNKTVNVSKVSELGLSNENLGRIFRLLHKPAGLILSAGTSGSGTSTILHACINELQSPEKNIITLEDPVEFQLNFATQVQTSIDKDTTPLELLRPILRQGPNVIMISEVRDIESATLAAEAALAGNLVISSVLASDTLGTIPRLLHFGMTPYWVATSLAGVVTQRLVRKICEGCKQEYQPTNEEADRLGTSQFATFYEGKGCEICDGSGYHGRTGIHEVLIVDDHLRDLIYRQASFIELKESAYAHGFEDIRADALKKATSGITTIDEVLRAVG
jgi:type II secretory ATPase GspE/PulE/Tfp pilus assembly ATPase PilB-like protein